MPKIDFYILSCLRQETYWRFACQLVEKAYKNKHIIYVHVDKLSTAQQINDLLWTYQDNSFLPHNLYGEQNSPAPPIQIGYEAQPRGHNDILLNLSTNVPIFYNQFTRVLECVYGTDQQQARARYRYYRAEGCSAIDTHKLCIAE